MIYVKTYPEIDRKVGHLDILWGLVHIMEVSINGGTQKWMV